MPVHVTNNNRSKRLTLRIAPNGQSARITTPPHVDQAEINAFLLRNVNWLRARIARMPPPVKPEDGNVIPFKGVDHKIIHLDRPRGRVEAKLITGEPTILVPGEVNHMPRRIVDFLKKQARQELNHVVNIHAKSLGVRPKSIRITDSKSRWGSCSSTRTLSFSWRIIMAPPEVLDYLAAHEVAHLREMNHSDRFWNLVEEICPHMEIHKSWLRQNGPRLHALQLA